MLLLFLASCAPLKLCLGSLEPLPVVDPTTAAATATTTYTHSPPKPILLVEPRSDRPESDAVGVAQAKKLDAALPSPGEDFTHINEAVMATFEDGSRASILALFNYPYKSTAVQNFFKSTMRAKLLSHYRFVRGRRVNGPFTPMCHTSDRENDVLRGAEGKPGIARGKPGGARTRTRKVVKLVQKADVILGAMRAATDPARQLTVKKIVTVCGFPIPVSSAGRHVLRQSTFDRCGPACVAMVGLDLGCRMPRECDFEPESAEGSTAPWVKAKLEEYCGDKISVTESFPEDANWLYMIVVVRGHFTLISNGREPGEEGVPMTMRDPMCGIEFIVTAEDVDAFFRTSMVQSAVKVVAISPKDSPPAIDIASLPHTAGALTRPVPAKSRRKPPPATIPPSTDTDLSK